jgi:hypothetical protein
MSQGNFQPFLLVNLPSRLDGRTTPPHAHIHRKSVISAHAVFRAGQTTSHHALWVMPIFKSHTHKLWFFSTSSHPLISQHFPPNTITTTPPPHQIRFLKLPLGWHHGNSSPSLTSHQVPIQRLSPAARRDIFGKTFAAEWAQVARTDVMMVFTRIFLIRVNTIMVSVLAMDAALNRVILWTRRRSSGRSGGEMWYAVPEPLEIAHSDDGITQSTFLVADDIMDAHPIGTRRLLVSPRMVRTAAPWTGLI